MVTTDELFAAFNEALARIHEWDGAGADFKLAVFGLEPESVRGLLEQRWDIYCREDPEATTATRFAQAFAEGLITGMQLERRRFVL